MNHLHNAIRKCSYQGHGQHWGGYLIPKEILALKDFGVHLYERDVELAIDWKRAGRAKGRWTFFNLDKNSAVEKEFKEIKRGRDYHD
jgi:hypothetical protein